MNKFLNSILCDIFEIGLQQLFHFIIDNLFTFLVLLLPYSISQLESKIFNYVSNLHDFLIVFFSIKSTFT